MVTYRVFGDTGGHYDQLLASLISLGLNEKTLKLETDDIFIHLGDLLHKGPGSNELMALVDEVVRKNPGQWIQLLGNHELQYLGGPTFWRDNKISRATVDTLLKLWGDELVHYSFALPPGIAIPSLITLEPSWEIPPAGVLFTHSGMTKFFWKSLGRPKGALEGSLLLNKLTVRDYSKPGVMLMGEAGPLGSISSVGPAWAAGVDEVWLSWNNKPMPFHQIHGHTSSFDFPTSRWLREWPERFMENSRVDQINRQLFIKIGNTLEISVDPGYDKKPEVGAQPFLTLKGN